MNDTLCVGQTPMDSQARKTNLGIRGGGKNEDWRRAFYWQSDHIDLKFTFVFPRPFAAWEWKQEKQGNKQRYMLLARQY